jgi:hypothetical protein
MLKRQETLFIPWQNIVNKWNSETHIPVRKPGWRVCQRLKNVGYKDLIPNLSHFQIIILNYESSLHNPIRHVKNANRSFKESFQTNIFS